MGNTVKVDDLAIFKVSVIGNGSVLLYDPDTDKTISASIGTIGKNDKTGPAVQSLKLLAQATGEYTRDELNKVAKLAGSQTGDNSGGTDNSGSQTGGGTDNTGGDDNGGGDNGGGFDTGS